MSPAKRRTALFLTLFASAVALRPLAIAAGPVLREVQREFRLDHWAAGLITALPVLCLGIFAPLGFRLALVWSPRAAMALGLCAVVVFGAARSLAPDVSALMVSTVGLGVSMGIAGSIPSMLVKTQSTNRAALATSVYAAGLVVGGMAGTYAIVPLSVLSGGWRGAMVLLSVPVLMFALTAIAVSFMQPSPRSERVDGRLPWRQPVAWLIAAIFGVQSLIYWGLMTWLPDMLVTSGLAATDAALLVAGLQGAGLLGGVAVGHVSDRRGTPRLYLGVASIVFILGVGGLAFVPSMPVPWIILIGVAVGAIFPLVLMLPVDFAADSVDAGGKNGLMLLAGYSMAALGPLAIGVVRSTSSDLSGVYLFLVLAATIFFWLCMFLTPGRQAAAAGGCSGPRA